ncbi:MAG: hypothetical protein ACOC2W_03235 [bacterium]
MDILLKIGDNSFELKNANIQIHDYNIHIKLDMDKKLYKKLKIYDDTNINSNVGQITIIYDSTLLLVYSMSMVVYDTYYDKHYPKDNKKININIITFNITYDNPKLYFRNEKIRKINEKNI